MSYIDHLLSIVAWLWFIRFWSIIIIDEMIEEELSHCMDTEFFIGELLYASILAGSTIDRQ